MEVCWVMAIADRGRLRPVVGDSRKAVSGGERGSPGRAVQAGIRGKRLNYCIHQSAKL